VRNLKYLEIRKNLKLKAEPVLFKSCDFVFGQDQTVLIVIPASLPKAETYTVSVSDRDIKFKADYENIAEMEYEGGEIFKRIAGNTQIGLVENPPHGKFPTCITNVAYVEVRRRTA
jgi:hypothetical protein